MPIITKKLDPESKCPDCREPLYTHDVGDNGKLICEGTQEDDADLYAGMADADNGEDQ